MNLNEGIEKTIKWFGTPWFEFTSLALVFLLCEFGFAFEQHANWLMITASSSPFLGLLFFWFEGHKMGAGTPSDGEAPSRADRVNAAMTYQSSPRERLVGRVMLADLVILGVVTFAKLPGGLGWETVAIGDVIFAVCIALRLLDWRRRSASGAERSGK